MTYLMNGFFILAQVPQTRTLTVDAQNGTLLSRTLLDSRQTSFHSVYLARSCENIFRWLNVKPLLIAH